MFISERKHIANMASVKRMTEIVYLKDAETDRVYTIRVTTEEAKRLENDFAFATEKLNEVKNKYENINIINTEWDNREETSHREETSQQSITQREETSCNNNDEVGGFKWPHEAILLLIEEYNLRQNDFNSGKMSQKKIWSLIAVELVKHGYNVTGPQCLSKFSGLKRTYKAVKDHNNKSGNGTRTWPYLSHMDNILGTKPFMSPISTVSSTGKRSRSPSSECSSISSIDSCLENEQKPMHKKVRQSYSLEKLIEDLKDDRKTTEDVIERRHKENIELRKRLLDSLETMIDIFKKK